MIILLDPYKQTNFKMHKCLRSVGYDEKRILDFANPQSVIEKIYFALNSDVAVEMIIADIYFRGDITSLKIIREFDSVPALWKTPFILYTNETDKGVIEQYMRYAKHIPLLYILKSNDESFITRTISNLSKHIEKNTVYIEAEMKVIDVIEMKDYHRISSIVAEFNKLKWEKRDIQMHRLDTLLGELYFEFWKESNKKLKDIQQKLLKVMRGTTAYDAIRGELTDEEGKNNFFLENAEKNLDNASKENPDYWKTNYIFYEIAMEKGDYKSAKEYLIRLIKIFPEEFNYSYQLGRIYAMENQYNIAMQHFEDASKKAVTEGIFGITEKDVLDITDESMKMAQKILKSSGASDFTDLKKIKEDSGDRYLLDIIKKNNAQIRTALYQLSKKGTSDKTVQADYQNKIAITFRRSGDYVMANNTYQEAIKLDPENPIIRLNSAACLALLNLFDQAKAEALKAMEYNKGDIDEVIISTVISLIDAKDIEGIKRILV